MSEQQEKPRRMCRIHNGELLPCLVLTAALETWSKKKGIQKVQIFDSRHSKVITTSVAIRSGEHARVGLLARFCPFCRTDISSHLADAPDPTMAEAG